MLNSKMAKIITLFLIVLVSFYFLTTRFNPNPSHSYGDVLDEFNGVQVFYNGGVNQNSGRNLSADGYNLGIKYQCVEFIKRYYYQRFNHKMPDSFGHAKSFFDPAFKDGSLNTNRGLMQYHNGSQSAPQVEDIIVFGPWLLNPYGHVAIVSKVGPDSLEVIQQNPGPWGASRETFVLQASGGKWFVEHPRALGWLRKPPVITPIKPAVKDPAQPL